MCYVGCVGDRVRSDPVPQPDGRLQLRGRRHDSRLRRAQAERRSQAVHVAVGGIHHGVRLPVLAQDTLPVPDADRAGGRPQRSPRRRASSFRHDRGQTAGPRPVCDNIVALYWTVGVLNARGSLTP